MDKRQMSSAPTSVFYPLSHSQVRTSAFSALFVSLPGLFAPWLIHHFAIPSVTDEQSDTFYVTVLCYTGSSTQFYKTLHMSCNTYALIMLYIEKISYVELL